MILLIQHNPIIFQGSKERLQRIISRSGGAWMPDRHFEITMQSYNRRGTGICFLFRCTWEAQADSIHISYRAVPRVSTLLIMLAAFAFFLANGIHTVTQGGEASLLAFLLPVFIPIAYLRAMYECIRDFRKLFSTFTD